MIWHCHLSKYVVILKVRRLDALFPVSPKTSFSCVHLAGAVPTTYLLHAALVHCESQWAGFHKVHEELVFKRLKKH